MKPKNEEQKLFPGEPLFLTKNGEPPRRDLTMLDPRMIFPEAGFNIRMDFDLEDPELDTIREVGVQQPITVWKVKDTLKFYLIDGERRWRKVMQINEEAEKAGAKEMPIKAIKAQVVNKPNDVDRTLCLLTANSNKPLNVVEKARVYKRLVDFGHSQADVARKIHKTPAHVKQQLDMLSLPERTLQEIACGNISATAAMAVAKTLTNPDDITSVVETAKQKQKSKSAQNKKSPSRQGTGKIPSVALQNAAYENEMVLNDGHRIPITEKIKSCQSCTPFACVKNINGIENVLCNLVENKVVEFPHEMLIITSEYQNNQLHVLCPLRRFTISVELV